MKPGSHLRRLSTGAVCLALSVAFYVAADNLPPGALFEQVGTAFFPKILAGGLALLSVLLMASSLVFPAEDGEEPQTGPEDWRAFYLTFVMIGLAVPLWWAFGLLATPLIMAGTMLANHNRRPGQIVGASLVATVLVYIVFFRLFHVPVPFGLLER